MLLLGLAFGSVLRMSSIQAARREPPAVSAYAGDAACMECHQKISAGFAHTAHHLTSQAASATSIHGSFDDGADQLATANARLNFVMRKMPDGSFTQTANYTTLSGAVQSLTKPIDIVTGSGRKGQTYLYWAGDQLFELPVSYWAESHTWINSPGYQDGTAHFDRPVPPPCLECHASFFEPQTPPVNRFKKDSLVLGVGCERCHGPGAEHVRLEQAIPHRALDAAHVAIVNPQRLSRERQIDVCALCHAGAGEWLTRSLSFQPGDVLSEYVKSPPPDPAAPLDVHTNQVQLLRESKCFAQSLMTSLHVTTPITSSVKRKRSIQSA